MYPTFNAKEIHSLTEFRRDYARFLRQMKRSGKPKVLTVNGKAAVVVQDAAAYQRMVDFFESVSAIRGALDAYERGEGVEALPALEAMARKHGIPR